MGTSCLQPISHKYREKLCLHLASELESGLLGLSPVPMKFDSIPGYGV